MKKFYILFLTLIMLTGFQMTAYANTEDGKIDWLNNINTKTGEVIYPGDSWVVSIKLDMPETIKEAGYNSVLIYCANDETGETFGQYVYAQNNWMVNFRLPLTELRLFGIVNGDVGSRFCMNPTTVDIRERPKKPVVLQFVDVNEVFKDIDEITKYEPENTEEPETIIEYENPEDIPYILPGDEEKRQEEIRQNAEKNNEINDKEENVSLIIPCVMIAICTALLILIFMKIKKKKK